MKKVVLNIVFVAGCAISALAQGKASIAVANPKVNNLFATSEIAAKLIRYELTKIEEYSVFDEFDMKDIYESDSAYQNCLSKTCLTKFGTALGTDFIVSGSFDGFGNKIVISLKFIDVKSGAIYKSGTKEFDNQEAELQRMTEILIKEMHGIEVPKELKDQLQFKNEVITSNNVGKINNSGPRIGIAYMTGSVQEFALRDKDYHGLGMKSPVTSMIGYQFEGQYVGTENFSALVEGIVNVTGLEQSQFIPSITIMNGFRFGKAGWEIAFGPGLGIKKTAKGFFDNEGKLSGEKGQYYNENDFYQEMYNQELYPENFTSGYFVAPSPSDIDKSYKFKEFADKSGKLGVNAMFVIAAGRSFRAGALNIPVNVFYSSRLDGGMIGASVGFNVMKSKKPINTKI